jgi:hypothetical protein
MHVVYERYQSSATIHAQTGQPRIGSVFRGEAMGQSPLSKISVFAREWYYHRSLVSYGILSVERFIERGLDILSHQNLRASFLLPNPVVVS